jgi:serine/threonine-protein kinase
MEVRRDLTGEIVDGRFRVEERLGGGGMGTVWRVQHVVSLQKLAMKTLDPASSASLEATERFLREARAAAALRTRHVVRIVDAQMSYRHDGAPLPFLVMELLEGKDLQQVLEARGRLPPEELVWVARQLGRALEAAHRQGIVHRDLKPSNVFVAEDEEGHPIVKLCDFGIAKLLEGGGGPVGDPGLVTRTGALLGTPMYLAPELLRGAATAVPPTDQWALGLLAFRALAGHEYFGHVRAFPELVLHIASEPLVAPSARAPRLPAAFDAWFLRSCARQPEERFGDVAAQVAALEAALGHVEARPIALDGAGGDGPVAERSIAARPTVSRAPAAPRQRSRTVAVAGAVVWALAAIAAVGWVGTRAPSGGRSSAGGAPPPRLAAPVPAAVLPPPAPPPLPPAAAAADEAAEPAPPPPVAQAPSSDAPAPAAPSRPAQRAAPRHRHASGPRIDPAPAAREAHGLPRGASCRRSAECASGLCAAEACL